MTHHPLVRWAAGVLFVPALVVWTVKLLEPNPVPEPVVEGLGSWAYLASKCLHAGGYAFLALLTMVWAPERRKAEAVAALLAHGVATEVLQALLPFNRSGKVTDVLIDWVGVGLGVVFYQVVTRRRPPAKPAG